jgi:hypothetical protein
VTPERFVLAEALGHLMNTGAISTTNTAGELAQEAELFLAMKRFQVVAMPSERLVIRGYPCTCGIKPWCIEHPFGPPPVDTSPSRL